MQISLIFVLVLTYVVFAVTSTKTRTFNVTSLAGTVKQLQYPWQQYSECLYKEHTDVLYCMGNYPYRKITPVWKNEPEQIKYVKVNCLWTNPKRRGTCLCKNRSSVPSDSSQDEKYFGCNLKKLGSVTFNNTSSIEVVDLSDNLIIEMERQTFNGLPRLRYCSLDRNLLLEVPDKLFCSTPDIEFVSLNGLNLEHFPSHSFFCRPKLEKLTVLEIRGSHLKDVPRDSLDYLPGLEYFDLGGNNLVSIYKTSFAGGTALKQLNLSGNALQELFPHFCSYMQSLTHLHLRANRISTLSLDELDDCTLLVDLDLSQNKLASLTGNASSLTSLQKLNVSRNNISSVDLEFSIQGNLSEFDISQNTLINLASDQFSDLGTLKLLNLSNNLLKDTTNLPALFAPLAALQTLDLSNNKLPSLHNESFSTMSSLKYLLLSGNVIRDISPDAFKGLVSLERLFLDKNSLTLLTKDAFKPLTTLKFLSLSFNSLTSLGVQSWPKLSELYIDHNKLAAVPSTIPFSDLDVLDVSNNRLSSFIGTGENLYVNFERMKSLDISYNSVSDISPRALQTMRAVESLCLHHNLLQLNLSQALLQGTPNLTYLNLAYNQIRDVENMFSQNSLENVVTFNLSGNPLHVKERLSTVKNDHLQVLDMSNCNLSSLHQDFFWNFDALASVYLDGNNMDTFPAFRTKSGATFILIDNPLVCACNMLWLLDNTVEVEGIRIPVSSYKLPKCSVYTESGLYNPKLLERRQYMCPEVNGCDSTCVCYKTNQTGPVVNTVCNNNLKNVPSAIPSSSLAIFLDGNDFSSELSLSPFMTFDQMSAKELYLNNSAIGPLDYRTFQAFDHLEILNLEDNVLEMLPTGIFSSKSFLRQLYLKNNILRYFEKDVFNNLPKLDELDISGNMLVVLSTCTLSDLSLLNARYFFLAENPWACNCSNRGFKMFVDKVESKIRDRRSLFCDESNREILQLSVTSFTCGVTAPSVGSGKPAMIVGILLAVLVACVLLTVFVYYRREMLALLYVKTGCHIPGRRHQPGMHFDTYISYDQNDQHCSFYVQNRLLPKLKNNSFNYQTSSDLIEDAEVIQKVIEDSKSSIFIVNKNFTSNPFQLKVFQGAEYTRKVHKFHKVVIIIHGDIDLNVMEQGVMKYLRKGDYITSRSRLWWERLIYELPVPSGLANTAENDDVSESDVIVFSSLNRDQYENM